MIDFSPEARHRQRHAVRAQRARARREQQYAAIAKLVGEHREDELAGDGYEFLPPELRWKDRNE